MDKKDLDKFVKKYEPVIKKTGKQLTKAVQSAEEEIAKMYGIAQGHIELQLQNVQKEKVYHEIGKDVAARLLKGDIEIPGADKYIKKLEKINAEGEKVKNRISKIVKKKKKSSKKK